MRNRRLISIAGAASFLMLVLASATGAAQATPGGAGLCVGGYADDFSALSAQARDFDRHPEATFSYCTRNAAIYECLSYGPDGAVRRQRKKAVLHGTAFAYRRQGADTLLLTNDHVAAWPAVTDAQHSVDGIPVGCKRISETLTLVDDEHDDYGRDDVALTRVVSDPQLDVAVLKAHADLHAMPWKIGHSAALRERNVVEVRGFPLGAFRATNLGKVISEHDHDDYGDWDHDDFVIDALLSAGNSGSPVLAVSCATGEYELVGIYHAGYTQGSALNVVVGIDQVRDLMTTLKRGVREHQGDPIALGEAARAVVQAAVGRDRDLFFPFGGNVAEVRSRPDGTLLFALFARDFPLAADPMVVVEDRLPGTAGSFGEVGRVWFGVGRGLKVCDWNHMESDVQGQVTRLLDALRADATAVVAYRGLQRDEATSRQTSERALRTASTVTRTASSRADLVQGLTDLADHLGPQPGEEPIGLAEVVSPPSIATRPAPPSVQGGPIKSIALTSPAPH